MDLKNRRDMVVLQTILSGVIFTCSPVIMIGYFMGVVSAVNMLKVYSASVIEYAFMILLGTFMLYPVLLNIYGWYMVIRSIPYTPKMFLYPFFAWIALFAWHLSWYFQGL
jgi:hypothetical protein